MMPGRELRWPAVKEVHALLPLWLGSVAVLVWLATVAATSGVGGGVAYSLGLMTLGGAAVALGALSIGHEYTHRTLEALLSQPTSRLRILFVKQSVLAVMLLAMAGIAWGTVLYPSRVTMVLVVVAVMCGLFVAPWLTMLCRNPFAGALFTVPIAAWTWFLVDWFAAEPVKLVVFQRSVLGLCAVAGVLGYRKFMRLEAIEGRGAALHLPTAAEGPARAQKGHPFWPLARKELALQQLTFAVAALYVVSWGVLLLARRVVTTLPAHGPVADGLAAVSVFYGGVLALVIGSLGSAEERQLRTLEWQLLQPVPLWQQWMVKVGVVLGLAVLLLIALPALVVGLSIGHGEKGLWYACTILLLTCVSLNVSSLNSNGLRAFLLSIPVSLAALAVMVSLASMLGLRRLSAAPLVLFAGFLAVVLYLAFVNHRSVERGARRVVVQVFCLAGCLAFGAALLTLL